MKRPEVSCKNEKSPAKCWILSCKKNFWLASISSACNCSTIKICLLVLISVCINGDVRLVGGSTAQEGRVEFCNDNTWGTVCDDSWGTADASVVCRQLGFPVTEAVSFSNAAFGQGTGPIFLDDVNCIGNESSLADCSHSGIGIHNCAHSDDAGVRCQATSPTTPSPTGQLRKFF